MADDWVANWKVFKTKQRKSYLHYQRRRAVVLNNAGELVTHISKKLTFDANMVNTVEQLFGE